MAHWRVLTVLCFVAGVGGCRTGLLAPDAAVVVDAGVGDAARAHDFASGPSDFALQPWDLLNVTCGSNCSSCPNGNCCRGICCGPGEWCDGNLVCRCGQGPACSAANPICGSAGPVGGNSCGFFCCGGSNPCPL